MKFEVNLRSMNQNVLKTRFDVITNSPSLIILRESQHELEVKIFCKQFSTQTASNDPEASRGTQRVKSSYLSQRCIKCYRFGRFLLSHGQLPTLWCADSVFIFEEQFLVALSKNSITLFDMGKMSPFLPVTSA